MSKEKLIVPKELGEWLEGNKHNIAKSNMLFALIEKLSKAYSNNKFADFTDAYIQEYKKELIEVLIGTRDYEVEEPKVYARVKGWELMLEPELTYFNKTVYGRFILASKHLTGRTKPEWAELGINDSNADFEEVQG